MQQKLMKATFAGGCFWCMQPPFRNLDGVKNVVSGYAGGKKENPIYDEVSTGTTGHLEAVQVTYDPAVIPYERLLGVFWQQIDPTDAGGQFADRGSQYHTAIFYHDEEQRQAAEGSKKNLGTSGKFGKPIATEIRPFVNFFPAEEYHQDYDRKKPDQYQSYKLHSGRAPFIEKTWGMQGPRVKVFGTPGCKGCRAVKELLTEWKVPFEEIDMASDEEARNFVMEKTGHLSSPIVQIGDEFIVGVDRKRMAMLLK